MDESGIALELLRDELAELRADNKALKERIDELQSHNASVEHRWQIAFTPLGSDYYLWRCGDCGAELRNESPTFPRMSCKNGEK